MIIIFIIIMDHINKFCRLNTLLGFLFVIHICVCVCVCISLIIQCSWTNSNDRKKADCGALFDIVSQSGVYNLKCESNLINLRAKMVNWVFSFIFETVLLPKDTTCKKSSYGFCMPNYRRLKKGKGNENNNLTV